MFPLSIAVMSLLILGSLGAWAGPPAPAHDLQLPAVEPVVPPPISWEFNEYWRPGRIGPRNFYPAGQGPYLWLEGESLAQLRQVGLLKRVIPGHLNFSYIKYLRPSEREKLPPDATMRRMIETLLDNGYPIHTIFYCRFQGNPPPDEELRAILDRQWIGDDQPETVYRLEPVFHYLKTGERWVGSSMHLWDPEAAKRFFADELVPRLEHEFPFLHDLQHQWTHPELRRLSDIYCEEFYRPVGRCLVWGMYVGSYHMASLPSTVAVGEKGADAFAAARLRGLSRQFGGGKFTVTWRGHEPTEMWTYINRAWYTQRGDEWGLPLPHIWYYIYRPYLIGANYYINEGMPATLMQDIEGDGQMELSTLGYIYTDMLDYADRHPDRGVIVSPIALMLDYNRAVPSRGVSYFGYNLPNDAADFYNQGVFETLFPEHRHAQGVGSYSRVGPYGEIFDLLQPNVPDGADSRALENYHTLVALGGMTFDEDFSAKVIDQVRAGATLVLCAGDITGNLPEDFLGLRVIGAEDAGGTVTCRLCGVSHAVPPYRLCRVALAGAEPVMTDEQGRPVVTRHRYGQGHVIALLPTYPVQEEQIEIRDWRGVRELARPLLAFMPHFFEHLTAQAAPVEVCVRPEDRPDLSWHVARKGDGWLVTMYNFSCAREEIVPVPGGTAKMHASYPLKELPFQIVCRTPVADVLECYRDRDVNWALVDGHAVISETMHGGEIRVYELQPHHIELPTRTRYVNYALHRPVTASSFLKDYPPENAVDGNLSNDNYWWSDSDAQRHYVFDMPQWLRVDLEQVRTIDQVFVRFHTWEQESLLTRLRVYKYVVEASEDGQQWTAVMDESRNEDNARPEGTRRWFAPVRARYVRLTVLRNSAFGGAQVVEFEVAGPETEQYQPVRQSIVPDWEVQYPPEVRATAPERITWLTDLPPMALAPGWLPAGKTWAEMNGSVKLVTDSSSQGRTYEHSLYGQSVFSATWELGGRYKYFVAAAGLGSPKPDASVEFIVQVDGQERFHSDLYRIGRPVLPVLVDVTGAQKLTLLTTDGGDGITNDYAWWGEARLIAP